MAQGLFLGGSDAGPWPRHVLLLQKRLGPRRLVINLTPGRGWPLRFEEVNQPTRMPDSLRNSLCTKQGFIMLYLSYAPPAYEYGTRPFLRWVRSQRCSLDASGSPINASSPVGIPLFGAPQATGVKPNPSEARGISRGTDRTVQHATRTAKTRTNRKKCAAAKAR